MDENITYLITENKSQEKEKITYEELLQEVNQLEINYQPEMDDYIALEINYNTNYTKKDLMRVADYYEISKRKKRKQELAQDIVIFEKNPLHFEIVYRRKKLWSYIEEIKEDKYLSKYLIFN